MKLKRMLFFRSFLLSASTIGGGFVIIAGLRRIYVEQLKLIDENEMLDIAALAQSAPGAAAVNASILLGYRLCGIGGALSSLLGTILPPLFIMMFVSSLYGIVRNIGIIGDLMLGMQAGAAAVIFHTGMSMSKSSLSGGSRMKTVLFLVLLAAVLFTDLSGAILIPAAGAVMIIPYFCKNGKDRR